ncbi:MAG: PQQ-like beta-propeller repeat protein [Candidatus Solibacter usitatus]|nr:PQQ-like beta-propeller repeat protein [Candidatus Solibacter usitatus]
MKHIIAWLPLLCPIAFAEDWPEWRGKGRQGEFREEGILDKFPDGGLTVRWRVPVHSSFAGPAVADGRVFVMDWRKQQGNRGTERVLALDEKTGKVLWTREWPADYTGLQGTYAIGPRATPTVDGGRVYVQGAMGALFCLNAATGEIVWSADYVKDFKTRVPVWGMTAAPLVAGNRLICLVAGEENSKVMAFDKMTGKVAWRALDANSEPGYSPPIMILAGGRQQVIQWHAGGVASLDPETGSLFWQHPWRVNNGLAVGTPVHSGSKLFVSAFYNGPVMFHLDSEKPGMRMAWKGKSDRRGRSLGLALLRHTRRGRRRPDHGGKSGVSAKATAWWQ